MSLSLLDPDKDKLGRLHDKNIKGEIESYVVVSVMMDGTTEVNFDIPGDNSAAILKIGGGLTAAYDHLLKLGREMDERAKLNAAIDAVKH